MVDTGTRWTLLDLTGVEQVDEATADHLVKVARARLRTFRGEYRRRVGYRRGHESTDAGRWVNLERGSLTGSLGLLGHCWRSRSDPLERPPRIHHMSLEAGSVRGAQDSSRGGGTPASVASAPLYGSEHLAKLLNLTVEGGRDQRSGCRAATGAPPWRSRPHPSSSPSPRWTSRAKSAEAAGRDQVDPILAVTKAERLSAIAGAHEHIEDDALR